MNIKKLMTTGILAMVAMAFAAMPGKQELKKVEGLVQELMRPGCCCSRGRFRSTRRTARSTRRWKC